MLNGARKAYVFQGHKLFHSELEPGINHSHSKIFLNMNERKSGFIVWKKIAELGIPCRSCKYK